MSGAIWLWWIGAVGLSGLGTWLVLRGLFGHRRIASRTRRCPRCKYDMTGRPGEMTCPECGFTAEHEARFYGGRRRWWPVVVACFVITCSFGLLVVPESIERGGVAWALPGPVRDRVLIELVVLDDSSARAVIRDAVDRVDDRVATDADLRMLRAAFRSAARQLGDPSVGSERAQRLAFVVRPYARVAWTVELDLSDEEVGMLLNSPRREAVALGSAFVSHHHERVSTFEDRLIEIGSAGSPPASEYVFMAFVERAVTGGSANFPDGMWDWRRVQAGYVVSSARYMLDQGDATRAWVLDRLVETQPYAIDAVERWSESWRRTALWNDEDLEPFVAVLVDLLVQEDMSKRNKVERALERTRDVHVPLVAAAIARAPTPRIAEDVIDVLRGHDGDASASLPAVQSYAIHESVPFRWAKRAANDYRSIRSRFDAEDAYPPIFAMPIYRRALAATDWDDPDSVARLMIDWMPHRDDGTVALAELVAAGEPSPFVVALARDAAAYYNGDLIERLTRIARDERLADETRDIARRLASDLEDIWPGLIGADGGED